MQIHILVSESNDSDQPLPSVTLVPADDDVFPGDLAAQLARASLTPGLILFGCVDRGEAYPVLRIFDLEDDGVAVDDTDHLIRELMEVGWQ